MTAHAAAPRRLPRRATLVLSVGAMSALLSGCVEAPPPQEDFPPLTFGYLPKLRLDVANIQSDVVWTPQPVPNGEHVEAQSPVQPTDVLRRMVQDRLVPGGSDGQATVTIDDASLVRVGARYEANFAVHMDIHNGDGTRSGYAEARVARTRSISDYSPEATRQALYLLVKAAMADMNVEFEYQIRHSLAGWLQATTPAAPPPPPVEQQNLGTPSQT
jgi:hypothetical protein